MGFKSPEDELAEFLAAQPSWLRKILQLDHSLSREVLLDWKQSDWLQEGGKIEQEYERLLKRVPVKWREYCDKRKRQALEGLPSAPPGRPRKDSLAEEAKHLRLAGKSHAQIAAELNRKHGAGTTNREAIRKLLSRKRRSTPDKT